MRIMQSTQSDVAVHTLFLFEKKLREIPGLRVTSFFHDCIEVEFESFSAFNEAIFAAADDPYAAIAARLGVTRGDVKSAFFTALFSGTGLVLVPSDIQRAGIEILFEHLQKEALRDAAG